MEIDRSFTVKVPLAKAWDVLGTRFHDVGSWATGIDASRKLPQRGPAGVQHRQCEVPSVGTLTERVDTFDEDARTFSYTVIDGAPSFATHMGNTWRVEAIGPKTTRISFKLRAELKPVANLLMGWMMKRQMNRLCDQICDDLRTYIETGHPSASKRAAVANLAA